MRKEIPYVIQPCGAHAQLGPDKMSLKQKAATIHIAGRHKPFSDIEFLRGKSSQWAGVCALPSHIKHLQKIVPSFSSLMKWKTLSSEMYEHQKTS